jgi:hypothetical protein
MYNKVISFKFQHLQGETSLNVRAWEIKSGAFCKESFLSQEYNLAPNFFCIVFMI